MSLYLLCWEEPLEGGRFPRHYLGWTDQTAEERLVDHMTGRNRPARIVQAAVAAGRTVSISRVWPDGTPQDEAKLKKRHHGFSHLCPRCNPRGLSRAAYRKEQHG